MKFVLIILVFGFVKADVPHRKYLPPPGAIFAGGRPEDLQTPLELPKEIYSKTGLNENEPQGPENDNKMDKFEEINTDTIGENFNPNYPSIYRPQTNNINKPITSDKEVNMFGPKISLQDNNKNRYIPNSIKKINTQFETNPTVESKDRKIIKNIGNTIPTVKGEYKSYDQTPNFGLVSGKESIKVIRPFEDKIDFRGDLNKPNRKQGLINKYGIGDATFKNPTENLQGNRNGESVFDNFSNLAYQRNKQRPTNNIQDTSQTPSNLRSEVKNNNDRNVNKNREQNISNKYSDYNTKSNNRRPVIRPRIERPQAENDRQATIVNFDNIISPEGYYYSYDTSNGIHADETGTAIDGVKAKGSYSYVGDDGKIYNVTYTADENGYQPKGDHFPVLPDSIRALIEQANTDASEYDDGSYDEEKYGHMRYQGPIDRYYAQMQTNTETRQRKPLEKENDSFKSNRNQNKNTFERTYPGQLRSGGSSLNIPGRFNTFAQNKQPKYNTKKPVAYPAIIEDKRISDNLQDYPTIGDIRKNSNFNGFTKIPNEFSNKQYQFTVKQNSGVNDLIQTMTTIPTYYTTSNIPISTVTINESSDSDDEESGYVYIQPKDKFREDSSTIEANSDIPINIEENSNPSVYTTNVFTQSTVTPILRARVTESNSPFQTTDTEETKDYESSLTTTFSLMPSTSPMPVNMPFNFGITDAVTPTSLDLEYTESDLNDFGTDSGVSMLDQNYNGGTTVFPFSTTAQNIGNNLGDTNIIYSNVNRGRVVPEDGEGMMREDAGVFDFKTDKVIGEDFSGPKRPQTFDPITGYQY